MAGKEKSSLFDEIDHAITNNGELMEHEDADEELDGESTEQTDTGEGEESDDQDDGEAGGESPDDTEEGSGESTEGDAASDNAAAADRPRNPDGTFKTKEQLDADNAAAKGKKEEPKLDANGKPIVKPPDALNDPIPKELKKETQDRIRTLIDTTKTVTRERDELQSSFNTLVEGVRSTGTSPQQYGEMLSFMAKFNSQDPNQQAAALDEAVNFVQRLSLLLGREVNLGDPLASFPDLIEAVQKGQVTRQWAAEIARTRAGQQMRTQIQQSTNQEAQQRQAFEQAKVTARETLNQMEQQFSSDPQWEAKKAHLVPILQPLFAQMHPSQWPAAFQQAYQRLPNTFGAAPRVNGEQRQSKMPKNQPLRAGKGSGGGRGGSSAKGNGSGLGSGLDKKAGGALAAMDEALENMNG